MSEVQYISDIPNQNISYAAKVKDDYDWGRKTMLAYIQRSSFSTNTYKMWLKKLYDYYNGHIDIEDYKLVTAPFGKEIEGDWADVKNYPIIKPKVDLLRGEFSKRPKDMTVYVVNDDVNNKMLEELNKQINDNLEQQFINTLNEAGVDTGVPSQEVPTPEYIKEQFESSYRDKRAIVGQHAINFISQYNKLDEVFDVAWFDWMVTGEVYTRKGVEHNEVFEEVVNPLDIDYDKDPDLQFIEDGDWVVRRKYMLPSSIIDIFYDDLTMDEINQIETLAIQGPAFSTTSPFLYDRTVPFKAYSRLIEVLHVEWKSKKKIGIVDFVDEMGQPQSLEVTEDYTKTEGQTLKWYWVNEVWEGYRIGTTLYKRIRALENQRNSIDNPSKCKLSYNGRVFSNRNSRNISMVTLGIPYQVLYNATMHRLKLAMAKMKDDMVILDINLKPKNWDIDKWLLMADQTSIMFADYAKEGVNRSNNTQSRLQIASSTIQAYIELLKFIKQEWDEVCGITKQREGQITSSETVGGVERAVVQSSLITEVYFAYFDQFKEREYQGLLDWSKLAWINGKKTSFVMPETAKTIYIDIDGVEHSESEYGIFVTKSSKLQEKIKMVQSIAQPLAQNGTPGSTIVEILESDNLADIKMKLRAAEVKMQEYSQMKEKAQQEHEQQVVQMQGQQADRNQQYILEQIDRKGEWDMRKTELTALGMDEGDDNAAIQKAMIDAGLKEKELQIKNREIDANQFNDDKRMAHESRMKQEEVKIKEKEMANKLAIAKSKPKTGTK
jgi:hypothetical protein